MNKEIQDLIAKKYWGRFAIVGVLNAAIFTSYRLYMAYLKKKKADQEAQHIKDEFMKRAQEAVARESALSKTAKTSRKNTKPEEEENSTSKKIKKVLEEADRQTRNKK